MSRSIIALGGLVIALATGAAGYWRGQEDGKRAETARQDAQAVKDLGGLISSHQALIGQTNAASKQMRRALGARSAADAQTTQEFRDALASNADDRVGCVFPSSVMRQLGEAQARAADAASRGIRGAVPAASAGASGDW